MTLLELVEKILRTVSASGILVVTHDVRPGLADLLTAVEEFLDDDLPPIDVVSTGVLERARQTHQRLGAAETFAEFYGRVEAQGGGVPDLKRCWQDFRLVGFPLRPRDRMYHAMVTSWVYQNHFGGRLFTTAPARSEPVSRPANTDAGESDERT